MSQPEQRGRGECRDPMNSTEVRTAIKEIPRKLAEGSSAGYLMEKLLKGEKSVRNWPETENF